MSIATVGEGWVFEGWKAFLNRSVMNERIRSAIFADVAKATADATRRRARGQAGHPHPIAAIGRVLAGLSDRMRRAAREPIRESEMAEIRSTLQKLDAIAGEYSVSVLAADAMIEDGRQAYGLTPIDPISTATRQFGDASHYLDAEAERHGLPADLASRARRGPEMHRVATLLGQLHQRYRRAAKDEDGVAVTSPAEMAQIHAELGMAADEAAKVHALAGASEGMIAEAYWALGLERPELSRETVPRSR
jgi:hypothetical protein